MTHLIALAGLSRSTYKRLKLLLAETPPCSHTMDSHFLSSGLTWFPLLRITIKVNTVG